MVFEKIYRSNAWAGEESRSGPGSGSAATAPVAVDLLRLVHELDVQSVLDVACGDGWWMPDLPAYLGIDVARSAIDRARANHPDRTYQVADIAQVDLPTSDLVIFRDAMQHLPLAAGLQALAAIRRSGSRWLLASTFLGSVNVDIVVGDAYSPNLEAEPFSLGPPERMIADGYGYGHGDGIRDPRKMLGLWSL